METVLIDRIMEKVRQLPPEKLGVVYDFISYLGERSVRLEAPPAGQVPAQPPPRRDWGEVPEDPEDAELAEMGMADYAVNLEEYEERLARGEIKLQ